MSANMQFLAAKERSKAMFYVALLFLSGCMTPQPPSLNLSQPGRTQAELDQYVREVKEYTSPYPVHVLTPNQVNAYKRAEEVLIAVRQKEGSTAGLGSPDDYLIAIGETSDFYFVQFLQRLRASEPSSYQQYKGSHWSLFYNTGDFQPVTVVFSKSEMLLECFAVLLSDCPNKVISQVTSNSSFRKLEER